MKLAVKVLGLLEEKKKVNEASKILGGYSNELFSIDIKKDRDNAMIIDVSVDDPVFTDDEFEGYLHGAAKDDAGQAAIDKAAKKLGADLEKAFSLYYKEVDAILSK